MLTVKTRHVTTVQFCDVTDRGCPNHSRYFRGRAELLIRVYVELGAMTETQRYLARHEGFRFRSLGQLVLLAS